MKKSISKIWHILLISTVSLIIAACSGRSQTAALETITELSQELTAQQTETAVKVAELQAQATEQAAAAQATIDGYNQAAATAAESLPSTSVDEEQPAAAATVAPESSLQTSGEDDLRSLTILYTNDEHGWIAGMSEEQGAAFLVSTWEAEHGFTPDGPFLLLSGGDMWTGPAISTWFEGASTAEVMNAMGYSAAAVGNHEFDFGLDALKSRAEESDFPFVSANIRRKSDGQTPTEWGIEPFAITEVNGVRIGIIGLTTRSTLTTTNPKNISTFDFLSYEAAIRDVWPQLEAADVDIVVVPGHLCRHELEPLASKVQDLPIAMIGGGHCNELLAREFGSTITLIGGDSMASYAYANLTVDTATNQVVAADYGIGRSGGNQPNADIQSITDRWEMAVDEELDIVIGYAAETIDRRGAVQQTLITESWLWAYPSADIAMTNLGGFRADLPAGDVTVGDIVTVFPFSNVIIDVQLSGQQLLGLLNQRGGELAMAGVNRSGSTWTLQNGEQISTEQTYQILVNDFMYAGGDDFTQLAEFDPEAYNTSIDWRQPLIDWLQSQNLSTDYSIETAVENFDR